MKKILLLFLLIVSCLNIKAQSIDGIGKIRLGMTVSELRDIFGEEIKTTKDFNGGITNTFMLSKYIPVEGYYINDFNLSFYNDSLYAMYSIEDTNIKDALSLKYGEPKMEQKKETKEYTNGFGNTIEKIDQSFEFTWDTGNDDIICYYRDRVVHNSNGKPNRYTVFGIENQIVFNKIKMIKQEKNKTESEKQKQEKLKELDNL